MKMFKWILFCCLAFLFVILVGVIGPKEAHKRCIAKGGEDTVGRDMLCFDKERKLVK